MVKDVIHPLPPMAKLDWQRVADAWNFAAEAAEKPPADLAMGAGAVEAIEMTGQATSKCGGSQSL